MVTAASVWGVTRLRQREVRNPSVTPPENLPGEMAAESSAPPAQPTVVTIPSRTAIQVRLDHSISTDRVRPGYPFFATVDQPVVIDGQTVIPQGTPVKGRVVALREPGMLRGVPKLSLALESVELDGNSYDLRTYAWTRSGENHKKRNLEIIGGSGGGGALIGALAGGGKGALIGASIGAGAGTAGAALTGKKNIVLPAETRVTFELLHPVDVQLRS